MSNNHENIRRHLVGHKTFLGDNVLAHNDHQVKYDSDHDVHAIFDHVINRGVGQTITVSNPSGVTINWTAGDIYDIDTNAFVITESGTGSATNNSVNYLKWESGTTLTLDTDAPTGNQVTVAIMCVQDNTIRMIRQVNTITNSVAGTRRGLRALFPAIVINGLLVSEDTTVREPVVSLDVVMDAGTYWVDAISFHELASAIYSSVVDMVRHYHVSGSWDSDTNAEIDTANYDNPDKGGGQGLDAIPSNKWVKSMFVLSGTTIMWVYPIEYFTNKAQAINAALPTMPPGLGRCVKTTAIVYQQGDTDFTNAIFQDIRPGLGVDGFAGVTDHGSLAGLSDDDHTQYLLADGTRNVTGSMIFEDNVKALFGDDSDLWLYHDGSNSVIQSDTGSLNINQTTSGGDIIMYNTLAKILMKPSTDFQIQDPVDGNAILFDLDTQARTLTVGATDDRMGSITIWQGSGNTYTHYLGGDFKLLDTDDSDEELFKLATSSRLLTIGATDGDDNIATAFYGTVKNPVDNAGFYTGAGDDLRIYHDGSVTSLVESKGNQDLLLLSGGAVRIGDADDGNENLFRLDTAGRTLVIGATDGNDDVVSSFYGNANFADGIDVTGDLVVTEVSNKFALGDSTATNEPFRIKPTLATNGAWAVTLENNAVSTATWSSGWIGHQITQNYTHASTVLPNRYGIYINDIIKGGAAAITNNYGIYIALHDNAATLNYAIYSTGGYNYFGGNVGIGTASPNVFLSVGGVTANTTDVYASFGSPTDDNVILKIISQANQNDKGAHLHLMEDNPALYGYDIWYDSGNNQLNFDGYSNDAKTETMTLKSGNVGIGTTSPSYKLHVVGSSSSYPIVASDGTRNVGFYVDGTYGAVGTESNHPLGFFTNDGSYQMVLTTGGNVGIGTTNPTRLLDVEGSINDQLVVADFVNANTGSAAYAEFNLVSSTAKLRIGVTDPSYSGWTGGSFIYSTDANGRLGLGAGNAEKVSILPGGNVGIGTVSPDSILHVQTATDFVRFETTGADSDMHLSLKNDAQDWIIGNRGSNSDSLVFRSGGSNLVTIDTSGNLDVAGTITSTAGGDVRIGNQKIQSLGTNIPLHIDGADAGTHGVIVDCRFYPNVSNSYDLGLSSSRWDKFYINPVNTASATAVYIDADGQVAKHSSSVRYKDVDPREFDIDSSVLLDFPTPQFFKYKPKTIPEVKVVEDGEEVIIQEAHEKLRPELFGYMAEDIDVLLPQVISYDKDGLPDSVDNIRLTALVIEQNKILNAEMEKMKERIEALEVK